MKHKANPVAFLTIAFAILLLFSCSKDKDETLKPKTTLEKIQGVWQLQKSYFYEHYEDMEFKDSVTGTAADLVDFRTDGKVYSIVKGDADTSAYSLINDTKLRIEDQDFEIKTLTDNNLSLYSKDVDPSTPENYMEVIIELKK
jgi:hypothetical protein